MSITSKFIKAFDPLSNTHVTWLSHMMDISENIGPDSKLDIVSEMNSNPMNVIMDSKDALDWPHIHFVLSASYARAVLKKKAFIPE